jgi:hypothetical protein
VEVAAKLQLKPGQSVAVLGDSRGEALDDVWSALRFRPG